MKKFTRIYSTLIFIFTLFLSQLIGLSPVTAETSLNTLSTTSKPEKIPVMAQAENINLPKIGVPNKRVLLLQDVLPWESSANEQVLQSFEIPYDIRSSFELGSIHLADYALIIIASDQPQSFYDNISNIDTSLVSYVENGGVIEFHGADNGWQGGRWSYFFNGLMSHGEGSSGINYFTYNHPIATNVSNPFNGSSASHGHLNLFTNASVITMDEYNNPTTVEFNYGKGVVLASTVTLEIANNLIWDYANLLPNIIGYTYNLSSSPSADLTKITISERSVNLPVGAGNQVYITAHYSNGSTRDITNQATYRSSNSNVLSADAGGYITAVGTGSADISVIYKEKISTGSTKMVSARVKGTVY